MKTLRCLLVVGILWGIVNGGGMIVAQESETALQVLLIEDSGYAPDDVEMLATVFTSLTDIPVDIDRVSYDEYVEYLLESGDAYDVFALDQIWVADLAARGLLAPLDERMTRDMRRDLTPALKEAFVYQRQIWGVPFLLNLQFLFYNARMLQEAGYSRPPVSLEMLLDYMRTMKAEGIVEYPWTDAWQEGETLVMEYLWVLGAFDGQLFTPEGEAAFDQAAGVSALEFMKRLIDEGLAPPVIVHQGELAAKDDFLAERAAFTSSWLYLQELLNPSSGAAIAGNGRIGVLPASESVTVKTASVISAQGLSILAASERKEAAWQWVQFFTSPLVQRAFMYEMPVWTSVQTSEDAVLLDPNLLMKRNQLLNASLRPNLARYDQVSAILQAAIYQALLGEVEPAAALSQAKTDIELLLEP